MTAKREASVWRGGRFEGAQSPAQAAAQAGGAQRLLALEPRSRLLDWACGCGEQTLELARLGHRTLGLEPEEASFVQARRRGREEGLNVHFVKGDPRQIPYREEFDAVVSFSGAFGLLEGERDELRALESARKALKASGQLLLDLINREWLVRHFEPNLWEQPADGRADVVLDRYSFNFETGRLDNQRTLVSPDGARAASFVSQRVYALTEIKSLLGRAGFEYRQSWGAFDGAGYGIDSPRLIVLARKPAPRAQAPREQLTTAIRIKGRRKARG